MIWMMLLYCVVLLFVLVLVVLLVVVEVGFLLKWLLLEIL